MVLRANGEPIAQNTRLGCVVAGNIKNSQITNLTSANLNLYEDLKRFGEIESIPAAKTPDLSEKLSFLLDELALDDSMFKASGRDFGKRWHNEYLHSLQQRTKWRKPEENLQVGDLVIIKESNFPPANWAIRPNLGGASRRGQACPSGQNF
ncbi:hypothetical protein CEXT_145581 [Caerostris extrusa]|uniref:DUF5641 domain-containing protein n=1 Tax=Caerostris extrusa TaxID=172846 RepID=A0AAV4TR46_CAEEX|nr:hypothetical protein CEXT_145581 [Caerostris extrusa]